VGTSVEQPAELNNSILGALVAHLREAYGEKAVAAVLHEAGEHRPLDEIEDATRWSSDEQAYRLFVAAVAVTGDREVPRKAGEGLFGRYGASEVVAVLRSLGDTAAVLKLVAETASKQTTLARFWLVEEGVDRAVVACRKTGGRPQSPEACQYTAGVLCSIPPIFGMARADVEETRCQCRGDDACVFEVRWDSASADDPEVQASYIEDRVAAQTRRFEALEAMAGRLAQLTDVDEALRTITEQAGMAVRAPRYLLAARLPGDRRLRLHWVGMTEPEARVMAGAILEGPVGDQPSSSLVVEVAAAGQQFGRLAAFFNSEHRFLPEERRLLAAYAGHAAAALAQAAALADARERTETLTALLDLARVLAEVHSVDEVAEHVARAAATLAHVDDAAVLVWEPEDALLVRRAWFAAAELGGASGGPVGAPASAPLAPGSASALAARNRPVVLTGRAGTSLRAVASAAGMDDALLVPMVAGGELQGAIVVPLAGLADRGPVLVGDGGVGDGGVGDGGVGDGGVGDGGVGDGSADPSCGGLTDLGSGCVGRVVGLAGLAATALSNAGLLDRIRHQAEHDPLTGLPNLRLVDRLAAVGMADAARRGSPVAVLFVDLDAFKPVNDRFGHACGDRLLVEAASRLRGAVRGADTVGRVGGDEFVVVLSQVGYPAGAQAVAERIVQAFAEPFVIDGTSVSVGASVGVAVAGPGEGTLATLLGRADAAMYRAKQKGRGQVAVDVGVGADGTDRSLRMLGGPVPSDRGDVPGPAVSGAA